MMSLMMLRPSTSEDETFVNDLTRLVMMPYVVQTWSAKTEIEEYFRKNLFDQATTRIIYYRGQAVGRISVTFKENEVGIDNIHILPDYQGKGIGREVLSQILEQAKKKVLPVMLQVLEVNPAKKLYEELGFEVETVHQHRYHMTKQPG